MITKIISGGQIELLLLSRDREDVGGDGHCAAIRRAGVGAAVHAGAPVAAADHAAYKRGDSGCGGMCFRGGGSCHEGWISLAGIFGSRVTLWHAGDAAGGHHVRHSTTSTAST